MMRRKRCEDSRVSNGSEHCEDSRVSDGSEQCEGSRVSDGSEQCEGSRVPEAYVNTLSLEIYAVVFFGGM